MSSKLKLSSWPMRPPLASPPYCVVAAKAAEVSNHTGHLAKRVYSISKGHGQHYKGAQVHVQVCKLWRPGGTESQTACAGVSYSSQCFDTDVEWRPDPRPHDRVLQSVSSCVLPLTCRWPPLMVVYFAELPAERTGRTDGNSAPDVEVQVQRMMHN